MSAHLSPGPTRDPVAASYGLPPRSREIDHCSASGAHALAKRIAAYWAERGHSVDVRIETSAAAGGSISVVRSDLVNGAPHRRPASTRSKEVRS